MAKILLDTQVIKGEPKQMVHVKYRSQCLSGVADLINGNHYILLHTLNQKNIFFFIVIFILRAFI